MTCITNAKIILQNTILENKNLFFDTKIAKISEDLPTKDMLCIDAKGAYVSAGFIDIHIHGSGGADVMDATDTCLEIISTTITQTGTTSFLATTMTMPQNSINNALENIQKNTKYVTGANIVGVHLEGPFLNTIKHGAQDKSYIVPADFSWIENYIHSIKMITIAPEVEGNKTFIKYMHKNHPNIILSLGHSNASYTQSLQSFTWGISHVTHLFNAMNPYHHREPGIVGAVFDSDVSCDIIADLIHTHPSALKLAYKVKQDKLVLITDAMRAGCMKCGTYDLGGQEVKVRNGKALLDDGTLAGSLLQLNHAVKNMMDITDISLVEAIKSVTQVPATMLDLNKGQLSNGYDADIVIFDDKLNIITTIVNGEIKYVWNTETKN